ncbi:MAG: hypothetical protein BroJett040_00430 [Oligoflexia bacterium]|nr:MAG: hypothetical protein BroJett040_00430 [Oligoflexia bacterium]
MRSKLRKFFTGLKFRLAIPAFVQVTAIILMVGANFYFVSQLVGEIKFNTSIRVPLSHYSTEMANSVNEVVRYSWTIFGMGLDVEERARHATLVKQSIAKFDAAMEQYVALPRDEKAKQIFAPVIEEWPKMKEQAEKVLDYLGRNDPRYDEMGKYYINSGLRPVADTLTKIFNELTERRAASQKETGEAAIKQADLVLMIVPLAGLIVVFITLSVTILVGKGLIKKLHGLAETMMNGAANVTGVSERIHYSSMTLNSGAAQQAALLQQTTATTEEVSSMVSRNAENSEKSVGQAELSSKAAYTGQEVIQEMRQAIQDINDANQMIMQQIDKSNKENQEIVKLIQEVGSKAKVINDIVFQTKLLSFNASIEAARAGDKGKGFAVVAEEVGNLASMSGNAAREITELLQNSITKVETMARETKEEVERVIEIGRAKVDYGGQVAARCEETFREIVQCWTGPINGKRNFCSFERASHRGWWY